MAIACVFLADGHEAIIPETSPLELCSNSCARLRRSPCIWTRRDVHIPHDGTGRIEHSPGLHVLDAIDRVVREIRIEDSLHGLVLVIPVPAGDCKDFPFLE